MSDTPKYRLVYFDVRALGEPIRWIFAYSGTPFVDDRIPWDYPTWFSTRKPDFSSTVGQIPILYEEGKRELCQSHVISRYLAKKFGLVADNDWDEAKVDEVISLVHDLFITWRTTLFERDPERKKQMKLIVDQKFKLYYAKLSSILEEEKGDFILGNKVTHADFWLANFISIWDEPMAGDRPIMPEGWPEPCEDDIFIARTKEYPLLNKHKEAVTSLEKIQEWISKRHQTIA
ncbi:Glutathione S-transferase [Orchesella cincta]|uniref:glutathione transferase n=1 Tax=Orchesella cincta TaxID=48709 RepID=A0A1D2NJ06_ORCCI|nr:Glutathione S-transferase [Orchesella cincta]